jgi:hypothetical protein
LKGQVVQEALIAVVLALILFGVVSTQLNFKKIEIDSLRKNLLNERICNKLSLLMSSIATDRARTEIRTLIEKNVVIDKNVITVENYSCKFFGSAADTNLSSGKIRIYTVNGEVRLENV